MKKLVKILIMFAVILLTMLCTKTFATDGSLESTIEIVTPEAGIYGEGQEVTIRFTFNKKIKGIMPKYAVYFGNDSSKKIELETEEITEFTDVVDYKYTIKSGDNGKLNISGFVYDIEIQLEDETGNEWSTIRNNTYELEKNILADTTIEWSDFSNAKIKMTTDDSGSNKYFKLILENCTLKSDNEYYVHFSHDKDEEIIVKNKDEVYDNNEVWQTSAGTMDNISVIYTSDQIRDMFAEKGEIYATICEIDKDTRVPKIILKSAAVTRLANLPITQRIIAYFYDTESSTYCYEAYSENQQKLNYKIGKVTDLNLLKSLKAGNVSALKDLLKYSKNDTKSIGTGTIKLGKDLTITDKLNLVNEEYYYVYLQLDSVDGKYVEIEDVSLYQALVGESVGANLFSMTDKEFKWNLDEEVVFTDFSNAKATIGNFQISTDNPESNKVTFVVSNVIADAQKKHKFYFYISNETQNIPQYDSELWMTVDKFEINEETGECIIYTTNILDLPYINQIDLNAKKYISIYEVISDNEITTEKIEGTYKLVLNSKEVTFGEIPDKENEPKEETKEPATETEKEDNTTSTGSIPKAGKTLLLPIALIILVMFLDIIKNKHNELRDIR